MLFSRFIQDVACISPSFLFMAEEHSIPVVIVIFVYPFISWWTFQLFLPFGHYELCCRHSCTSILCEHTFSYLLGHIYLGIELIGRVVILWGTARLFPKATAPFYICSETQKFFMLVKSGLSIFSFVAHTFGVIDKKPLPNPWPGHLHLCVLLRVFYFGCYIQVLVALS